MRRALILPNRDMKKMENLRRMSDLVFVFQKEQCGPCSPEQFDLLFMKLNSQITDNSFTK